MQAVSNPSSIGPEHLTGALRAVRYLQRMLEEASLLLFDGRRGSCHGLVLSYFISRGGIQALVAVFSTACELLWRVSMGITMCQPRVSWLMNLRILSLQKHLGEPTCCSSSASCCSLG